MAGFGNVVVQLKLSGRCERADAAYKTSWNPETMVEEGKHKHSHTKVVRPFIVCFPFRSAAIVPGFYDEM